MLLSWLGGGSTTIAGDAIKGSMLTGAMSSMETVDAKVLVMVRDHDDLGVETKDVSALPAGVRDVHISGELRHDVALVFVDMDALGCILRVSL